MSGSRIRLLMTAVLLSMNTGVRHGSCVLSGVVPFAMYSSRYASSFCRIGSSSGSMSPPNAGTRRSRQPPGFTQRSRPGMLVRLRLDRSSVSSPR